MIDLDEFAGMTPGPWERCEPGDYSDYDGRCMVVLGDDTRLAVVLGVSRDSGANARAIAALPDLIAELRAEREKTAALRERVAELSLLVKGGAESMRVLAAELQRAVDAMRHAGAPDAAQDSAEMCARAAIQTALNYEAKLEPKP